MLTSQRFVKERKLKNFLGNVRLWLALFNVRVLYRTPLYGPIAEVLHVAIR